MKIKLYMYMISIYIYTHTHIYISCKILLFVAFIIAVLSINFFVLGVHIYKRQFFSKILTMLAVVSNDNGLIPETHVSPINPRILSLISLNFSLLRGPPPVLSILFFIEDAFFFVLYFKSDHLFFICGPVLSSPKPQAFTKFARLSHSFVISN